MDDRWADTLGLLDSEMDEMLRSTESSEAPTANPEAAEDDPSVLRR
jgi:hypothetical protein